MNPYGGPPRGMMVPPGPYMGMPFRGPPMMPLGPMGLSAPMMSPMQGYQKSAPSKTIIQAAPTTNTAPNQVAVFVSKIPLSVEDEFVKKMLDVRYCLCFMFL